MPFPRYVTSQLWMNLILIELNMTCKPPHKLPPCFCFDVHIFCCAIIYLFIYFLENNTILSFHICFHFSMCYTCYTCFFFFSIFMNWFMFPPFMFCLLISQSSFEFQTLLLVFVVWCDHESQNLTPKPLQDCIYKDVVFREWYEEVNVWYQSL